MGTKGRRIVQMDVGKLIGLLNKALADEWLAYYQYWVGAKVVRGPMKEAVIAELTEHAADELRHADMIANRVTQLGGTPLTDPRSWEQTANCAYLSPENPYVQAILEQGVEGERCAIEVYSRMLETTKDKDPVTYNMVLQILQDEVEHEEDFQALLEDIEDLIKRRG